VGERLRCGETAPRRHTSARFASAGAAARRLRESAHMPVPPLSSPQVVVAYAARGVLRGYLGESDAVHTAAARAASASRLQL